MVSIPLMIIVSLCTKPEYDKAALTSWVALGKEMKASTEIPESEKCLGKGFFGWLGADKSTIWKVFWICVSVVFIGHYVLSFAFSEMAAGVAMTWTSIIVGTVLIFIMAILGGKDIINMAKENKRVQKGR